MNLAEAFAVLAKTGCHLRVEAEGGIILDVSPGARPVPAQVLAVLAAHRESLTAVLAPTTSAHPREGNPKVDEPITSSVRLSPYAAANLARKSEPKPMDRGQSQKDLTGKPLTDAILSRARAAMARKASGGQQNRAE